VLLQPKEPNCIFQIRKQSTTILLHQITKHAASHSFRQMKHFQQALALAVSDKNNNKQNSGFIQRAYKQALVPSTLASTKQTLSLLY
jgi:hypothetical protein